jgi:hypothetical protein
MRRLAEQLRISVFSLVIILSNFLMGLLGLGLAFFGAPNFYAISIGFYLFILNILGGYANLRIGRWNKRKEEGLTWRKTVI